MMRELPWTQFKSFASSRSLSIQYIDLNDHYYMWAFDGVMSFECHLDKSNPDTTDKLDFENNFKATSNKSFSDSDGLPLSRVKMFKTGVAVRFHFFSFKTADIDSLHHKKSDGTTNFGHFTYKIYDGSNVEITDPANEGNAVKTVLDFEPASIDYEIVGGKFYQAAPPGTNVYVHVVGVPDVPEGSGGSVAFASDANLKLMPAGLAFETDGRVPKIMKYNGTYHTSKLRIIFYHNAGVQHECMGELEIAH